MKRLIPVVAVAVVLSIHVASAMAQEGGGEGAGGGRGRGRGRGPQQPEPRYPVSYQPPKVEEIKTILQRVHGFISKDGAPRIVSRATSQPITDLSKPDPDAFIAFGSYPNGVMHAGMLLASEVTGDSRYADYTASVFQAVSDSLPYFRKLAEQNGVERSPMRNFMDPQNLDACGAWGAALVKARRANIGPDLKSVIDLYGDFVSNKQFRLADGTLARKRPQSESLWGDDLYMSVPFLAQMGKLTGETKYYDDAAKQILQFADRLFIPSKGLFTHGWHANTPQYNPHFFWGRANGWAMMAMAELLEVLPESHPGREKILTILRSDVQALAELQSGTGLWHQLLDKPDSYLETSCSAMYVFTIARAINRGWISAPVYTPVAITGWNALTTKLTPDGGVEGVCIGTSLATDAMYYYHRPAVVDAHANGPVLLAGAEMIRLLNNPALISRTSRSSPLLYQGKSDPPATNAAFRNNN